MALQFMYSGISGMQANQQYLNVISNNIANSQTTAFKSSNVTFEDTLSQTVQGASGSTLNMGGINPQQVGMGTSIEGITKNMSRGDLLTTNVNSDLALDGNGFFIVASGPLVNADNGIGVNQESGTHNINSDSLTTSGAKLSYTRDGSFSLDTDGNLTLNGYRVMGYPISNDPADTAATAKTPNYIQFAGFVFQPGPGEGLNGYTVTYGNVAPYTPTNATVDTKAKQIRIDGDFSTAGNVSASDLQTAVNNALGKQGIAQSVNVTNKSTALTGISSPLSISAGTNTLIATIDGSATISITAADAATAATLSKYKISLGNVAPGTQPNVDVNTAKNIITIDGDFTSSGSMSGVNQMLHDKLIAAGINIQDSPLPTVTDGNIVANGVSTLSFTGGTPVESIDNNGVVNFVDGTQTMYAYDTNLKSLRIPATVYDAATDTQVKVSSYTVSENGIILGSLANGKTAALGQIALASFKNDVGLQSDGGNLYSSTVNSGDPILKSGSNTRYDDNSASFAAIDQNKLEQSNVDLSTEFTHMIEASRSFQANGKIISTGDEILQTIINLKQ
ncbi:MAG: flagellar hook-basal body complex protein [Clostridium sp.]|nr:flagellar hook-basal body complex protein [Clostridium sp.]